MRLYKSSSEESSLLLFGVSPIAKRRGKRIIFFTKFTFRRCPGLLYLRAIQNIIYARDKSRTWGTGDKMIDLKEILMANGITMLMTWFLLVCRRKNRENIHTENKIFESMALVNVVVSFFETVSFLMDGVVFPGSVQINYIANSICFAGTVSIGFLWCLYVDLRIYRNYKSTIHKAGIIMIPWLIEMMAIVGNLFVPGILFHVTADNVYARGRWSVLGYITLLIYFAYSIYLVYHSKRQGRNLNFFPVLYFILPCLAGVLIQMLCYGITSSWIMVTAALIFVQLQSYAENLYTDELSGLYNRRYFKTMLAKKENADKKSLYGIMMDINDFKKINDEFGHSIGDRALCRMGELLFRSVPEDGIAIRYAGDEFIVLLPQGSEKRTLSAMEEIGSNLSGFNDSGMEPFSLSMAMGYTKWQEQDDAESFLKRMDAKMYEEKRRFHQENSGKITETAVG